MTPREKKYLKKIPGGDCEGRLLAQEINKYDKGLVISF
jgi:hypothetical protein